MPKVFVVSSGAQVYVARGTNVTRIRGVAVSAAAPTAGQGLIATGPTTAGWADLATQPELDAHLADVANPHAVTKAQVELSAVENTALSTWAGTANLTTVAEDAVTAHQAALSIGWAQIPDAPAVNVYDLAFFVAGSPIDDEIVGSFVAVRAVTIADDFAGSLATAATAATAETIFTVNVNGAPVGTVTFAAAGTAGTLVTTGGAVALVAGDVLSLVAPAVADATIADVAITLLGLAP
jgi:hypothetical protein